MSNRLKYRRDIDGLRAVAVLPAIAYHYGSDWLPGGFAGVELFFVISGYLITSIIWSEMRAGSFSFIGFYRRRFLRIFPVLAAVVFTVLVTGFFVQWPSDYAALGKSAAFSLLGLSNFYFFNTSDYFSPASDTLPLLHTWSLGVEEQFYFLWPLLLSAYARFFSRGSALAPAAVIVASSLIICLWTVNSNPPAAFYLPWARVWELALGVCLVFLPPITGGIYRNCAGTIGLLLVVGTYFLISDEQPYPGWLALIPCIGAALLIASSDADNPSLPARLLGTPILFFIGRMSYSLYLWHWPILVFYWYHTGNSDPSALEQVALLGLTLLVSVFSRVYIEKPFLDRSGAPRRWRITTLFAAGVVLLGMSIGIYSQDGFAFRLQDRVARVLSYEGYDLWTMFRKGTCYVDVDQDVRNLSFDECLPRAEHTAVLWGSSLVAQFYYGLKGPLEERGYALGQLTGSACRPIPQVDMPDRPMCRDLNQAILQKLLETRPSRVILGGLNLPRNSAEEDEAKRAILALSEAGIAVDVLGYVPGFNVPVPQLLAGRLSKEDGSSLSKPSEQYDPTIWEKDAALARWVAENTSARYIRLLDLLCQNEECELLTMDGVPRYVDQAHMSREGSVWFGKLLAARLLDSPAIAPASPISN